jgi:DNA/RNA-binding domain of Phe-tRNA-synthetase-like protein
VKFSISPAIIEKYPDLRIGVVTSYIPGDLDEAAASSILSAATHQAMSTLAPGDTRLEIWPTIYRTFGINPRRVKPTVNALVDRVLAGRPIAIPLPVVAVSVAVCLTTLLPVGGYDLSTISGELVLRISEGGEEFHGIGDNSPSRTVSGEVVYADAGGILTRAWNHRDSERTQITKGSRNIVFMMEAPTQTVSSEVLASGLQELSKALQGIGAVVQGVQVVHHRTLTCDIS